MLRKKRLYKGFGVIFIRSGVQVSKQHGGCLKVGLINTL